MKLAPVNSAKRVYGTGLGVIAENIFEKIFFVMNAISTNIYDMVGECDYYFFQPRQTLLYYISALSIFILVRSTAKFDQSIAIKDRDYIRGELAKKETGKYITIFNREITEN